MISHKIVEFSNAFSNFYIEFSYPIVKLSCWMWLLDLFERNSVPQNYRIFFEIQATKDEPGNLAKPNSIRAKWIGDVLFDAQIIVTTKKNKLATKKMG